MPQRDFKFLLRLDKTAFILMPMPFSKAAVLYWTKSWKFVSLNYIVHKVKWNILASKLVLIMIISHLLQPLVVMLPSVMVMYMMSPCSNASGRKTPLERGGTVWPLSIMLDVRGGRRRHSVVDLDSSSVQRAPQITRWFVAELTAS